MFSPRGSIVRSARLRREDDGAVLTLSAPAVLVTVHATSESRRMLRRAAATVGCILEPIEGDAYAEGDGTFNRRTGKRQRAENVQPHTFRVVGPPDGLKAVCAAPCVREWAYGVNVRVPVGSAGAGELTPSSGKRLREAKRENGERAAERERAERRPFNPLDEQAETVRRLAPGADAETTALVAELVRYASRANSLTDSERVRVKRLREMLGA